MRFAISILGVEVFAVELGGGAIEFEAEDEEPAQWGGQSATATHIESPSVPYDINERYRWDEEYHRRNCGRRLGFHQ